MAQLTIPYCIKTVVDTTPFNAHFNSKHVSVLHIDLRMRVMQPRCADLFLGKKQQTKKLPVARVKNSQERKIDKQAMFLINTGAEGWFQHSSGPLMTT